MKTRGASNLDPSGEIPDFLGRKGDFDEVNRLFREGAAKACAAYLVLLFVVFRYSPPSSFVAPEGDERNAHLVTLVLLIVTYALRVVAPLAKDGSLAIYKSGFMIGTLSVQLVALTTNCLLAFVPTPVVIDPVTGMRSHLVRWVEFAPLTYLMVFLMTNVDASVRGRSEKELQRYSILIGSSSVSALIFPFCPNEGVWIAVLMVSVALYCNLFRLLYDRATCYFALKKEAASFISETEKERFQVIRTSYVLTLACTITWTTLVMFFICCNVGKMLGYEIFANPSIITTGACVFEVASKIWYLHVLVEVNASVFDETSRAVRRLEQMRNFMSAVWSSSSDVIVFCGLKDGRINARISPAFLKMIGQSTGPVPFIHDRSDSLVLDICPKRMEYSFFALDLSKTVARDDVDRIKAALKDNRRQLSDGEELAMEERNVAVMAELVTNAHSSEANDARAEQALEARFCKASEAGKEIQLSCEAAVAKVDGTGGLVLVVRDITDRTDRFEAEKKLCEELVSRKKDEETNKFTRHEIKNGILAAIALVDHVRETGNVADSDRIDEATAAMDSDSSQGEELIGSTIDTRSCESTESDAPARASESFSELESTLRDILDTILDEAMAREIVHDEYIPRKERTKVLDTLSSLRRQASPRFPIRVEPSPLPDLAIDRQLIRYIYRNAVSNACRYGKQDGVVESTLTYKGGIFRMEVVNAPGEGHGELIQLGEEAVKSVFSPGIQLPATHKNMNRSSSLHKDVSSGNGAWIMQKCAETLEGKCSIRFEETRTVFTFHCPAEAFPTSSSIPSSDSIDNETFTLPENTWGIVIDDSMVQRKIMGRFLKVAGIDVSRRVILGKTSEEVFGMCDKVASLMEENPEDKFLLIADENLDIEVSDGEPQTTVSGSKCVKQLRQRLDPETESRLLALIRSANDSLSDIELYNSRAHGYLLKEPIKQDRVLEAIRPWWDSRFASSQRRSSFSLQKAMAVDVYKPSAGEIRKSLDIIDALVLSVQDEAAFENRWHIIREKLVVLKGDLKTVCSKDSMMGVVDRIDRLMSSRKPPDHLTDQWDNVRSQVESVM